MKNAESLCDLQETSKKTNQETVACVDIHNREKRAENLFKEITAQNFTSLGRDLNIQLYDSMKSPSRINPNKSAPRHAIIKFSEIKEKNLKAAIKNIQIFEQNFVLLTFSIRHQNQDKIYVQFNIRMV